MCTYYGNDCEALYKEREHRRTHAGIDDTKRSRMLMAALSALLFLSLSPATGEIEPVHTDGIVSQLSQ